MKCEITGMLALLTFVSLTWMDSSYAAPLDIKVTPNTLNAMVVPAANELVTMGLPFNGCALTDLSKFRLLDEAKQEVPIFIKPTLLWPATRYPCLVSSVRAVKVQFVFNATAGARTYSWDLAGRNTSLDLTEAPVSELVTDNGIKDSRKEPRVFGIADPQYLASSGIVPATAAVDESLYDTGYLPTLWDDASLHLNYNSSGVTDWIYDRVTTNYRQALRRGELAYYREAYLSHEWYISKMEVTGTNTTVIDYCIGGFNFARKADTFGSGGGGCDTKYLYPQAYKLHLALTGDDSWQPAENGMPSASGNMNTRQQAWTTIAHLLVTGDVRGGVVANSPAIPAAGFIKPYTSVSTAFTERDLGFGLQAVLNACELTLDVTVCGWADTIVDNVRKMQIANPDGTKHYGYLSHSLRAHEGGTYLPWIGSLITKYSAATSIIVDNTFGEGYLDLTAGKTIRIGSNQNVKLANSAVDNGNGTWTLNLVTPVTASAGTEVVAVFLQNGSTVDLDHATDRIFSPWMQAITADAIWQYYNWTDSAARKEKAASILLGFARAYTAYALDGSQLSPIAKSLIEHAFTDFGPIQVFSATHKTGPCNIVTNAPYTAYFANALMASPENNQPYMTYITQQGRQNHNHIPEGFFQLSLGLLFETDHAKKAAMQAVLDDLHEWFEKYDCTANLGDNRAYSWSNKLDPWGTYSYVQSLTAPPPHPSDAMAYAIASKGPFNALVVATNNNASTAAFQLGASRDGGSTVQTVFSRNDQVKIAGVVRPQVTDLGTAGAIFIVMRTTTAAGDFWTYRNPDGVFQPWDNFIASLEPAYETNALKYTDGFEIHSGSLGPATHRIYIGYSRDDIGVLHYTGMAMLLEVTD